MTEQRVETLEAIVETLSERVTSSVYELKEEIKELKKRVGNVDSTKLLHTVYGLKGEVKELQEKVGAVDSKKLCSTVEELRTELHTNIQNLTVQVQNRGSEMETEMETEKDDDFEKVEKVQDKVQDKIQPQVTLLSSEFPVNDQLKLYEKNRKALFENGTFEIIAQIGVLNKEGFPFTHFKMSGNRDFIAHDPISGKHNLMFVSFPLDSKANRDFLRDRLSDYDYLKLENATVKIANHYKYGFFEFPRSIKWVTYEKFNFPDILDDFLNYAPEPTVKKLWIDMAPP